MAVQIIINQSGPLPISIQFPAPTDAPSTLMIAGSVWSAKSDSMIGISVILDAQAVGVAQIFSNGPSTHRAVVPVFIPVQLSQGTHTLFLAASTGETVSDVNDFFSAVLMF